MRRLLPPLAATLLIATAALAQNTLSTGPLSDGPLATDPMKCAAYEALDDPARIEALRGIEPFGDEIGTEDEGAAHDWAEEVARQCRGHPDRPLTEAAAIANQSIEAE